MAITPGAQTERRGDAGPVRACLAVRTSPAALFSGLTQMPLRHGLATMPAARPDLANSSSVFLLLHAEQQRRFRVQAAQLRVRELTSFLHPLNGLVVALA